MANALVQIKNENGIGIITLMRADKRNAIHGPMVAELREVLKTAAMDDTIHIILLQGDGDHFCAGGDIQWMCDMALRQYDENYQDALLLADLMYELYTFQKPTIALAHGATLGGGMGLLTACDIALGSEDSSYGFTEVKVGIMPAIISPYVIAAMGERWTRYYFLTGEIFNAHVAKQLGLLQQVVPVSSLFVEGLALAQRLLNNNLPAMVAAKKLVREMASENITSAITRETAGHLAKLRATPDAQEGLKAFIEKRQPRWQE